VCTECNLKFQFWEKDWFLYGKYVFSAPDTGTVCKAAFPGPTDLLTDHTLFHITECSGLCFSIQAKMLLNTCWTCTCEHFTLAVCMANFQHDLSSSHFYWQVMTLNLRSWLFWDVTQQWSQMILTFRWLRIMLNLYNKTN